MNQKRYPPPPEPPPCRLILENSGGTGMCPKCGSSMRPSWRFWRKRKGCIQPKCDNFEA